MTMLQLPENAFMLEEANLPAHLARSLAGRSVEVRVLQEELPGTRQVEMGDYPLLVYPDGSCWNDYRPLRVSFVDSEGNSWQLPRGWIRPSTTLEPEPDSTYSVEQTIEFAESMHLPSEWDLLEINIPEQEAGCSAGLPAMVRVRIAPGEPVGVFWRDSQGIEWHLPHKWRRRRVRLPDCDSLIVQGVPQEVAAVFAKQAVSVNYHPGSLCCLPDQYRFRDRAGNRYPVHINDCILMGYGDAAEHLA